MEKKKKLSYENPELEILLMEQDAIMYSDEQSGYDDIGTWNDDWFGGN